MLGIFTSYLEPQDGIEGVEVEYRGTQCRVFFSDLIDLQIDLFNAGLDAESIRLVLRDVERARQNTMDDAYWEEPSAYQSKYQWSAAPYWGPRPPHQWQFGETFVVFLAFGLACCVLRWVIISMPHR